jgi:hypothetical protein
MFGQQVVAAKPQMGMFSLFGSPKQMKHSLRLSTKNVFFCRKNSCLAELLRMFINYLFGKLKK